MEGWLTAIMFAAPFVAATVTAIGRVARTSGAVVAPIACRITTVGFLAAVAGLATSLPASDIPSIVAVDNLASLLAVLVLGLSALIQSFAVRYLRGDSRQGWFVVFANLLTGFTVIMVSADAVVLFGLAWICMSASLVALLATYPHSADAVAGIRRTTLRFVVGDAALVAVVAVLVVAAGWGVRMSDLPDVVERLPRETTLMLGLAVVTAALARSAQVPFHGWLPATLAAPTPVSALMHAGVVNAGAIVIIRFSPIVTAELVVMSTIFVAGAVTVVYAVVMRLVKPDAKGRLVFSTMAQMGFMLMACGLGAFAAAIFHLVAHSLYKSALFLGASRGVRTSVETRRLPVRVELSRSTIAGITVVGTLVAVSAGIWAQMIVSPAAPSNAGLFAFVALSTAVALITTWLVRFTAATVAVGIAGSAVVALGYTLAVGAVDSFLGLPTAATAASPWLVVLPALALIAAQLLTLAPDRPAALSRFVYRQALARATPPHIRVPPMVKGSTS